MDLAMALNDVRFTPRRTNVTERELQVWKVHEPIGRRIEQAFPTCVFRPPFLISLSD